MMTLARLMLTACLLSCFLISPSLAQGQDWKMDPNHSSIYFDVRHTFVPVRGLFDDFSAAVSFDAQKKDVESIDFQVQVDSIDTNITKRDNHLRSDDFFAARLNFPSTACIIMWVQGDSPRWE